MLRALSPLQARLLALFVLAFCVFSATRTFDPPPSVPVTSAHYTDMMLYHDIADKVREGVPYHQAARDLQSAHNYPTRPFVTIRLPTLAEMAAVIGWKGLQALLAGFLLLAVLRWYRLAANRAPGFEPVLAAAAVLIGGAMVTQGDLIAMHDFWVGVLGAGAMTFRGGKHWPLAVLLAGLAVMIRELAVPFVFLALAFALYERRRAEALGWTALLVMFGMVMAWHAQEVLAVVQPSDKQSLAWSGLRGISGFIHDLTDTTLLNRLIEPLAFFLIPLGLVGWTAAPRGTALFGLLYCLGMATMIALFSRPDNFYWSCMLSPVWFIGFAFLPRALSDLTQAALARRAAAL